MSLSHISPDDFPKQIQLQGMPIITRIQFSVLLQLYDDALPDARQVFKALVLPGDKQRAGGLKASALSLQKRDYIVGMPDNSAFKITLRGVRILKACLVRCLPKDEAWRNGLCFRCRQKPRHQMPSRLHSWCLDCIHENQTQAEAAGQRRANPEYPCARCGTEGRYTSANGTVYMYCKACKVQISAEKRTRRQARDRARLEAGEALTCKCGQPVYVTAHYVSRRCKPCELAKERARKRKRSSQKSRGAR